MNDTFFEKDLRKIKTRYYNKRKCTLKQYFDMRKRLEDVMDHDDFLKRATYRDKIPYTLKFNERKELGCELVAARRLQKLYWLEDIAEDTLYCREKM